MPHRAWESWKIWERPGAAGLGPTCFSNGPSRVIGGSPCDFVIVLCWDSFMQLLTHGSTAMRNSFRTEPKELKSCNRSPRPQSLQSFQSGSFQEKLTSCMKVLEKR